MSAYDSLKKIRIPLWTWRCLVRELKRRGNGERETGAFLLGCVNGHTSRVEAVLYYDDLDPAALETGMVTFHGAGYAALYDHCRQHKLDVIADIHTHPGRDVRQSGIDRRKPMLPTPGHTAMIAPRYGDTSPWSLKEVGVYEYLGHFQWRTHSIHGGIPRVSLCLF